MNTFVVQNGKDLLIPFSQKVDLKLPANYSRFILNKEKGKTKYLLQVEEGCENSDLHILSVRKEDRNTRLVLSPLKEVDTNSIQKSVLNISFIPKEKYVKVDLTILLDDKIVGKF